ncbi:phage major capsid protein, P2 family [Enterobacter sp. WCHEn045836]|uniref:phage major capsid protein, P2 family n=1 Tax=Enterobacter sp. WCHEn045836 TaxID=2497434 RepID=UPI000F81D5C9|nr:phage major capsid protein, P2 family [Enterobacter sp. WCHEn045836]RTP98379.1 phage major capsid protein, P2 family [Enterobacter sp. WCHEn045836]
MLSHEAQVMLHNFTVQLAKSYGAKSTKQFFSITPPMDTKLRKAILHSEEFLTLINTMQVRNLTGQVVATGNPGLFTGRKKDGRFSRKMGNTGNTYSLAETDSGSYLDYETLTSWANAGEEGEFFSQIQEFSNRSFALDILRVGFNGVEVAETTDPEANPNGEDVNIGWHQIVKVRSPEQIVSDEVILDRVGTGADFVSLDAAASDLRYTQIAEPFRNHPDLVVLVSPDLIAADTTSMMNRIDRPSEKFAAQLINREIAGMKAYTPPFMPEGRLIVTPLWNLHLYNQVGTGQRKAEWVDDRKRFENNYLRMEGYAVEHDEIYAAFDNIKTPEEETEPGGA